jgi:hypothetical protein
VERRRQRQMCIRDRTDPVPNGVSYGRSGEPKTTGIKMRGIGAATKGVMSRGPMA